MLAFEGRLRSMKVPESMCNMGYVAQGNSNWDSGPAAWHPQELVRDAEFHFTPDLPDVHFSRFSG